MPVLQQLMRLPALASIYRSFGVVLALFFVAVAWPALSWVDATGSDGSLAEYANGFALGIGALLTLVIAHQHPLRSTARLFWWCMALGLVVAAANEAFDVFDRVERAWGDDDYADLILLFFTPIGLYWACVLEAAPRIAISSMKLGFLFQFLSDLIDLGDGDGQLYLYTITFFDRNLMAVLTDISELIFIETYLFGLGCLLLHIVARGIQRPVGRV